jgi:hypothetical protein
MQWNRLKVDVHDEPPPLTEHAVDRIVGSEMQSLVETRTNEDSEAVEQVPASDEGEFERGRVRGSAYGEAPRDGDWIDARFPQLPPSQQ